MSSDESIRSDASTVHRGARVGAGSPAASSPADGIDVPDSTGSEVNQAIESADSSEALDVDELAQAKTVIRGSSRGERPSDRLEGMGRTPAAVAQVLLGQRLNHFLLEELIGGGGMGAVFRAHDEHLDRTVAIKVIPFVGNDPDLQRRFRNEAQSAAKLDHPRIARVYDAGSHDEWHYIVFEYIQGINIRDLVNRTGVLSIDEAVFYTSQLAEALQHAADRGIVHRDIKPSNVLIGDEGKIKLVDMGLARSDNLDLSEDMTASGVTLGTFDYISPEQAKDPRDADLRSDLYSLGCTLYFMVTGQPPYPGGTMLQKLLSHGNSPPPDPRELRPEVSGNLTAVIQKMLAKHPGDRYQSANDLIADLREVAMRDGLPRSQALAPILVSEPNPLLAWLERHAPWVVAASLLIGSAGWLHLESAATRQEITVPPSATQPTRGARLSNAPTTPAVLESDVIEEESEQTLVPIEDPADLQPVPSIESLTPATRSEETVEEPRVPAVPIAEDPAEELPGVVDVELPAAVDNLLPESDSSEAMATPSVIRIVDVLLSEPDALASDGAALTTTLSGAINLAEQYGAERIEVAAPVLTSPPVELRSDLAITSSVPGGSTIVFLSGETRRMERSEMFTIGRNEVEFEDLHFVWKVPNRNFHGGAMFEVHDNPFVRLTDCSVTIDNATLHEEVYGFEVVTDPDQLPRQDAAEIEDFPTVWIELNNVVVRGQMTMLSMDYAAKLMLFWDNGLLAVTERMVDTAGARNPLPQNAEPISLWMAYVTAHAPLGIMRTRAGVSGAYPVPVDRFARKSVFRVDPSIPHFEFLGLSSIEPAEPLLQLRGASNAYDVEPTHADPMLRLYSSEGDMKITRINDLIASSPEWVEETRPRWEVPWKTSVLSSGPASERTPADYEQEGLSPAGFDAKSLPTIPPYGESRVSKPPVSVEEINPDGESAE